MEWSIRWGLIATYTDFSVVDLLACAVVVEVLVHQKHAARDSVRGSSSGDGSLRPRS